MASVIGLKEYNCRAVVVVQLAERSLPTPEIRSSNPDIGNEIYQTYLSVNCYHEKTKIKIKASGIAYLKKNIVAAHGHAGPLVIPEFKPRASNSQGDVANHLTTTTTTTVLLKRLHW